MTNLNHPFLKDQIIAYIGNKRQLLPLIDKAIAVCSPGKAPGLKFLDLFSGSGVVSRMAKLKGFEVISNDWEVYSRIINQGFLETGADELESMYKQTGGIDSVLDHLNNLPKPDADEQYISRYYCPGNDDPEKADFRRERLFYSRQNGLIIDAVRNEIERMSKNELSGEKEKNLLIALLLYRSATHTNTSGVFKAYHKGFGGHGKDALSRILKPIKLTRPVLINSEYPCRVYAGDANKLVRKKTFKNIDIAYLDPPYNQHQYGSNYHLLKTIAVWDKPSVNNELNEKGVFKEKSAIRKDWTETRSDYCYKDKAVKAFTDLLENLDAGHILISYSTEGIIPFDEMRDICRMKGYIDIITNEYIKYRGGRQSNSRLNRNIEFILTIDTSRKSTSAAAARIDEVIEKKKIKLLFGKYYKKRLLESEFSCRGGRISADFFSFSTDNFFRLTPDQDLDGLDLEKLKLLEKKLMKCICLTREDELKEILERIKTEKGIADSLLLYVPSVLRKLAHKKYKKEFLFFVESFTKIFNTDIKYKTLKNDLEKLEDLAEKRFSL